MTALDAERSGPEPQVATLTALRFFAAAWVVLFHYWPNLSAAAAPAFVGKGYLGVELFFVLSGFVISYVYQGAWEDARFRYGSFLWARLARVYPMHLVTLLAVLAMAGGAAAVGLSVAADVFDLAALPANLLLLQAWGLSPSAAFNHPSWSISAEWFAYLSFPVFASAAAALGGRPRLAVGLAAALTAGLYWAFEGWAGFPLTQATIAWGALRIVPCFALGCAVHLLWRAEALRGRGWAVATAAGSAAIIVGLAGVGASDTLLTLSFGGLIFGLASLWRERPTAGATHPVTRVFAYLGEISYSTYMICIPWKLLFVNGATKALGIEGQVLPGWLWAVFILSLIPLSALSFHLIEKPARGWLKAHRPAFARTGPGGATLRPAT